MCLAFLTACHTQNPEKIILEVHLQQVNGLTGSNTDTAGNVRFSNLTLTLGDQAFNLLRVPLVSDTTIPYTRIRFDDKGRLVLAVSAAALVASNDDNEVGNAFDDPSTFLEEASFESGERHYEPTRLKRYLEIDIDLPEGLLVHKDAKITGQLESAMFFDGGKFRMNALLNTQVISNTTKISEIILTFLKEEPVDD